MYFENLLPVPCSIWLAKLALCTCFFALWMLNYYEMPHPPPHPHGAA